MKVASLFKKYKVKRREGKVYDPIRGKYVHATPEEYVRQKTIQFLIDYMEIPSDRIIVERSLSKLGVEGDRRRIDIGFFDPEGGFMAVVECKESLVGFNENAFVQAQDYLFDLHARFFFVTDGIHYCELELSFAIHPNSHPNHWGLTLNWGLLNWGVSIGVTPI